LPGSIAIFAHEAVRATPGSVVVHAITSKEAGPWP
jgi:hypothetical protein